MTEDYKQKVFDYITGDYEIEQPSEDIPAFSESYDVSLDLKNYIITKFNAKYPSYVFDYVEFNKKIFQAKSTDDSPLGFNGITGFIQTEDEQHIFDFILICDNEMQPLKLLMNYDSGTNFREFIELNVAEDGTLYGVDRNRINNAYRFIMLNNIFLTPNNEFYANLRYSFNLTSAMYNGSILTIAKAPNESSYFFSGGRITQTNKPYVTFLKINVGEANEWKKLESSSNHPIENVSRIKLEKVNDVWYYGLYAYENLSGSQGETIIYRIGGNSGGSVSFVYPITVSNEIFGCEALTRSVGYFIEANSSNNIVNFIISKMTFENSLVSREIIKTIDIANSQSLSNTYMQINENFIEFFGRTNTGVLNIGLIEDDKVYYKTHTYGVFEPKPQLFFVNKQFNLFKFFNISNSAIKIFDLVKNNLYNGTEYQDFNSFIPYSSIFEDTKGIQFARNIVNNTYFNNIITSSLLIPNLYLNGVEITKSNLLGQTNNKIIENNSSFAKNIYEEVYVNFLQRYRAIDKNDTSDTLMPVQNGYISSDLVTNLQNPEINYESIKLTKYRLNYADNTSKTIYLDIVNKDGRLIKYLFSFYVEKELNSIDLISEDENTIYLTIENNDRFEVDKYYSLTQEMTIE